MRRINGVSARYCEGDICDTNPLRNVNQQGFIGEIEPISQAKGLENLIEQLKKRRSAGSAKTITR